MSRARNAIGAALGAIPNRLVRTVTERGLGIAGAGVALGTLVALAVGPRIEPLLYHTSAKSPLAFGASATIVVVTSIFAAWLPGRRASRLDPVEALRAE